MIITLLSWIWVALSSLIIGFAVYSFFDRISPVRKKKPHLVFLLGLCFLTVYAQLFSIFYKVSLLANVLLFLICLFLFIVLKRRLIETVINWKKEYFPNSFFFICFLTLLLAYRTSTVIYDGDTYLYHLQAIRWITDYGVVPGLGNLNTRFAFNSSFLCLQALFSFDFLPEVGPLSGVNGFVVLIVLSYAVCEMKFWRSPCVYPSDFARLAVIMVVCKTAGSLSSPGTDIFANSLVLYVFAEWVTALEETNYSISLLSVLSVLAAFSVTLKLSSAMVILLALLPIFCLLKEKNRRAGVLYLLAGMLILAPFLIRNIIISGWIVYPFEKLDLFSVDWKMPVETVRAEAARTTLFARSVYYDLPHDSPLSVWFPHWLEVNGKHMLLYITADLIAAILSTILLLRNKERLHRWELLHVCATIECCILYVAVSAPSMRFGKAFVFLLPLITAGLFLEKISVRTILNETAVMMIVVLTLYFSYIYTVTPVTSEYLIYPAGYADWVGDPHEYYGYVVYTPAGGTNRIGWEYFPSAIYESTLERIELRGDSFHYGFRVRDGVKYLF